MPRTTHDQRPLWEPWLAWQQLPDQVRQQVLDVLTAFYLETVHNDTELKPDDSSSNDETTTSAT